MSSTTDTTVNTTDGSQVTINLVLKIRVITDAPLVERDHFADELEERVNLDPYNPDALVRHAAAGGQESGDKPEDGGQESDETVKEIVEDTFDAAARAVDDVVRFSKAAEAAYRVYTSKRTLQNRKDATSTIKQLSCSASAAIKNMNEELSSIESFADVDDLKDLIAKAEDILGGIKTLAAELEKAADKAKQKKAVAKREDEVNDFLSGAADLLGVASPEANPD